MKSLFKNISSMLKKRINHSKEDKVVKDETELPIIKNDADKIPLQNEDSNSTLSSVLEKAVVGNEAKKTDDEKSNQIKKDIRNQFEYSIKDDYLKIKEPFFHGKFSVSENEKFTISWMDSDVRCAKNGKREICEGEFILISEGNQIIRKKLERPNDGKVSNNGTFIINDYTFIQDESVFYVFDHNGKKLIEEPFESELLPGNFISDDGKFAACFTAQSLNLKDSNVFLLFDIEETQIISRIQLENIDTIKIDLNTEKEELSLFCNNETKLRYKYDGTLISSEKKDKNVSANQKIDTKNIQKSISKTKIKPKEKNKENSRSSLKGIELYNKILKDYQDNDYQKYSEVEQIIEDLVRSEKEEHNKNNKAKILRFMGEIYMKFNKNNNAIECFEQAIKHNPKVGVKRLLNKLR